MSMSAPILFAVVVCLPFQAGAGPPKSPWPAPYEELGLIYQECCDVYKAYVADTDTFAKLSQAALKRKRPLHERLALLRDWVRCADKAHAKGDDLAQRFDLAYRQVPAYSGFVTAFNTQHKGLRQIRVRIRMLLYCEVLRHRWSWEWKGLGFNGRCLQLIAARCGFAGNHELFSRSIGEVEAALGDVANFAKAQWIDLWTPIEYEPEPKLEPKPKQANDGKRPPAPAKP